MRTGLREEGERRLTKSPTNMVEVRRQQWAWCAGMGVECGVPVTEGWKRGDGSDVRVAGCGLRENSGKGGEGEDEDDGRGETRGQTGHDSECVGICDEPTYGLFGVRYKIGIWYLRLKGPNRLCCTISASLSWELHFGEPSVQAPVVDNLFALLKKTNLKVLGEEKLAMVSIHSYNAIKTILKPLNVNS